MKNLVLKFLSVPSVCFIVLLSALCSPAYANVEYQHKQCVQLLAASSTYSWSAHASADSYQVVLTPRASGSPIVFNTTNTWISLAGVPSGVYDVTVYAVFLKASSIIIIEDIIIV